MPRDHLNNQQLLNAELIDAVLAHDLQKVRIMIDLGAEVNSFNAPHLYQDSRISKNFPAVPLVAAITVGKYEIVDFLIEQGANINLNIDGFTTPYIQACKWFLQTETESISVESKLDRFKIFYDLTFNHNPDFNPQTREGSPLTEVIEANNVLSFFVLPTLVDRGAKINFVNTFGSGNVFITMMQKIFQKRENINKDLMMLLFSPELGLDINPNTLESPVSILLKSPYSSSERIGSVIDTFEIKVRESDLALALRMQKIEECKLLAEYIINFSKDNNDANFDNNIILNILRSNNLELIKKILGNEALQKRIKDLSYKDVTYLVNCVLPEAQVSTEVQKEFITLLKERGMKSLPTTSFSKENVAKWIEIGLISGTEAENYLALLSSDQAKFTQAFTQFMEGSDGNLINSVLRENFSTFAKMFKNASKEFQESFKLFCKEHGVYYSGKFGNLLVKSQLSNLYELDHNSNTPDIGKLSKTTIGPGGKLVWRHNDQVISEADDVIYVANKKGELYIQSSLLKGGVHHSYFIKGKEGEANFGIGKPVACGGHLSIKDGKIISIDNNSGHYQATTVHLFLLAIHLESQGVLSKDVKISNHDTSEQYTIQDAKKYVLEHFDEIFNNQPEYILSNHTPAGSLYDLKSKLSGETTQVECQEDDFSDNFNMSVNMFTGMASSACNAISSFLGQSFNNDWYIE